MFCLRDGSALWSNASSVDGRKCGEAYEWEVSEKFQHVGLEKPESISVGVTSDQLQGWKNMKSEADRLTKEIVGESTHSRITSKFPDKETKGGPEQANRATGAADLEGRVNGQISLRERLGSSAEILFGGDVISGNVVVEVSVMSALLLMKMAQLERYLQLRQLAKGDNDTVDHCVIIVNRKPITILASEIPWQLFPQLCSSQFSVVSWPHSVSRQEFEQVKARAEHAEAWVKRLVLSFIFVSILVVWYLQLLPVL